MSDAIDKAARALDTAGKALNLADIAAADRAIADVLDPPASTCPA